MSESLLVALQEMPMSYKSARLIHTAVASCSTRKLAPMPFLFPIINNYRHHLMAITKNNITPKRTKRLEVRVTSDEYNRVAELANTCGLTVSNYVRKCVLGQHPKQRLTDREIEALCSLADARGDLIRIVSAVKSIQSDKRGLYFHNTKFVEEWMKAAIPLITRWGDIKDYLTL